MEKFESFDEYIDKPREQAYSIFQDRKNLKIFRFILTSFSVISLIMLMVNIATIGTVNFSLFLIILNFITVAALRTFYKKVFNITNIRRSIFVFLISQLVIFLAFSIFYPDDPDDKDSVLHDNEKVSVNTDTVKANTNADADSNSNAGKKKKSKKKIAGNDEYTVSVDTDRNESLITFFFFMGIVALILRFSRTEILQLMTVSFSLPMLLMILFKYELSAENIVPNLFMGFMFFGIAIYSEQKKQKTFFEQYDFYFNKNHENLRMKKELNYAREIQLSMLPENEAVIGELEIAAISLPASEVGGDYFDYFRISENEIGLFICDVSGHGVASGLLLSGLRSCMHLILEDNTKPKVVIEKLNRMIRKTQNRKMFVTAVFAIIDLVKNKCFVYNAGHLPPYKISGESKEIFKIKKHGIALGAMNTVETAGMDNEVVFDFNKNDKIILYTDGVNEAMDDNKAEYGLDNLEFYLNNNADKKASELLNGLIEDVKKFTRNSNQRDDLTLLIVQRN